MRVLGLFAGSSWDTCLRNRPREPHINGTGTSGASPTHASKARGREGMGAPCGSPRRLGAGKIRTQTPPWASPTPPPGPTADQHQTSPHGAATNMPLPAHGDGGARGKRHLSERPAPCWRKRSRLSPLPRGRRARPAAGRPPGCLGPVWSAGQDASGTSPLPPARAALPVQAAENKPRGALISSAQEAREANAAASSAPRGRELLSAPTRPFAPRQFRPVPAMPAAAWGQATTLPKVQGACCRRPCCSSLGATAGLQSKNDHR